MDNNSYSFFVRAIEPLMKCLVYHVHANFGMWHCPDIYLKNIAHAIPEVFWVGCFQNCQLRVYRWPLAVLARFREVAYDRDTYIYIMLVFCWGNVISGGKHVYMVCKYHKFMLKVENN